MAMLADLFEDDAHLRGWEELSEEEEAKVLAAREDYNAFVEYVFEDKFHNPIRQQWFHIALFTFLCTHNRAIVEWANDHGKSRQLIYRSLWKLGRRPSTTSISIIMDAARKAEKTLAGLKNEIMNNVRLHRVFPNLRKGDLWRQNAINVEGHGGERDPSVQALGIGGQINGDRQTDIEMDDVLTFHNTLSLYQSKNIVQWIQSEVLSRLQRIPAGVVTVPGDFPITNNFVLNGTPWTRHDAIAHFTAKPHFFVHKLPIISCEIEEIRNPIPGVTEKKIAWPEAWTLADIQEALEDQGETEFLRTKMLRTRNPRDQRFKDHDIITGLRLGKGMDLVKSHTPRAGEKQACGIDLANADKVAQNDCNVFFQLLWTGRIYRPQWLDTDASGRWAADEHIELADDYFERYPRTRFVCESNLGQKHFADLGSLISKAKFEAVFTGAEKRHPKLGVEGMAFDLAKERFALLSDYSGENAVIMEIPDEQGKTHRFSVHPKIAAFIVELQNYRPDDRHIPDILAAAWKAWTALGGIQTTPSATGARTSSAGHMERAKGRQF